MPTYTYYIFGTGFEEEVLYSYIAALRFAQAMKNKHGNDVTLIKEHTLTMEREELDYAI